MKPAMAHEEAFSSLGAVTIDALDASERDATLAHVAGCPDCRAEFEALRSAAAALAFVSPAAEPRTAKYAEIRDRLLTRATAESQARRIAKPPLVFPKNDSTDAGPRQQYMRFTPPPRSASSGRSIGDWVAVISSGLLVLALGALAVTWQQRDQLSSSVVTRDGSEARFRFTRDSLVSEVKRRDSLIATLTSRDVAILTLTARSDAKDAYGRVFWDRNRSMWNVFAHNMPALKAGRGYQVWIITAKATVNAGMLSLNGGNGSLSANLSVAPENLRSIAVTEEPLAGSAQPTGGTIIALASAR